jgi:hypothetical protein
VPAVYNVDASTLPSAANAAAGGRARLSESAAGGSPPPPTPCGGGRLPRTRGRTRPSAKCSPSAAPCSSLSLVLRALLKAQARRRCGPVRAHMLPGLGSVGSSGHHLHPCERQRRHHVERAHHADHRQHSTAEPLRLLGLSRPVLQVPSVTTCHEQYHAPRMIDVTP